MPTSAPNMTARSTGYAQPLSQDDRDALSRIAKVNPKADPASLLPDVPPSRIPRHIAVIMDGNGRWAAQRSLGRSAGHRAGGKAVRATLEACSAVGVEMLTLYSFSIENWKRPAAEVGALMELYLEYMAAERHKLVEHNIRFMQIGRRDGLSPEVLKALELTLEATKDCTGPILNLAVNYGGRADIVDAARSLAERAARGEINPKDIDEAALGNSLSTAGLPDPDLLIRTAGEMRVSNFLLWEISYAELHVTPTLWPDFDADALYSAIRDYASRTRRLNSPSA